MKRVKIIKADINSDYEEEINKALQEIETQFSIIDIKPCYSCSSTTVYKACMIIYGT